MSKIHVSIFKYAKYGDTKIRICLYITMKFNLLFKDRSEWQQALWLNVIYVLIKTNLYKKILILSWSSHYVDETQTLDKKYLHYAHASNRQGRVRKRSPWLRAQWHNIIQTSKVNKGEQRNCFHCRFYSYLIVSRWPTSPNWLYFA